MKFVRDNPGFESFGRRGAGEWQDDLGMIHDPTSVSYELRVTRTECRNLLEYWTSRKADFRNYSFERQANSCNCVCAAVEVLQGYLKLLGRPEAQYLNKVTSPEQGKLMGLGPVSA